MIGRIGENGLKWRKNISMNHLKNVRQSTQMKQAWNEREANYQLWYASFKNHLSMRFTVGSRLEEDGRFCTVHFHHWVDIRSYKDVAPRSKLGDKMELRANYDKILTSDSNHNHQWKWPGLSLHCRSMVGTNSLWYTFSRSSRASTRLTHFRINSSMETGWFLQ